MHSTPTVVLVVEDEPLIRLWIVDDLQDRGFVVFEAANADDAVAILNTCPEITFVFTDIDMPGSMDGLKLAAFIRDRWPPIKIIVTSGRGVPDADLLPTGSPFFSKPYDPHVILEAIHRLSR